MIGPAQVHQLLRTLAAQPVLPAMHQLPANDEGLHALLAEVAGGERSRYAEMLSHVATEAGITPEELARRAEFLLACLVLPVGGSYYDMLGVAPTATPEEIRRRRVTSSNAITQTTLIGARAGLPIKLVGSSKPTRS